MSDKSELKAELERKKQRLAQIREEKKRKEEDRKKKELDGRTEGASPPQDDSDLERKRREAEALLQSMGIVDASMVQPLHVVTEDTCLFHYLVPPPMSPSAKSVGTPSETGSQDSGDGGTGPRTLHWDSDPSTLLLHSDSQLGYCFNHHSCCASPAFSPSFILLSHICPLNLASHQYPELLVASYSSNEDAPHEPDGVALVWNMKYKKTTPEYVFHCQFPLGDVNNFVVGSEDGSVYTACRHGSKAGISEMFEGHHGPITGLDCHTAAGPVDFSHLFVTSSFDWTVKLWSTKNNKPLYSFEDNSDYVYDVMWSPTHPALFACVDGVGHLDLWNLNNETEVPTASVTVEGSPALNRVRWAHSGREVAVGDSEGQVHIYDIGEQISVPRQDEWTRFVLTLTEINENREDVEELAAQRLAA
ncbi:cytoplasmic dynein 1 intermediate chain 2-like [Sinocyclocheilus rhinocerous]|uniref:cytoplasmic dynein 1 intermediate chain 2-like n=1 Tax=Sinocyclocheilus rhinocerous TaxID=307959 RepID=UPI0007BA8E6E|nr:PREDICTED: cytoplasmic dynein 1 intermediate chain 2-like [Sinocyclocheilus rhinocerous]